MDGIHDMGGMHGFGPVSVDDDQPGFPEHWQSRVMASNLAMSVHLGNNTDRFRFMIELIPPAEYLAASYYERWLASLLARIEENGLLDAGQLAAIAAGESPVCQSEPRAILTPDIAGALADAPAGERRDMSGTAAFRIGDRVRARALHVPGHTRLPRYVRGHAGEIVSDNGNQHLPDLHAASGDVLMQRLYTVSFKSTDLWGAQANSNDSVRLDLWESYLEPA